MSASNYPGLAIPKPPPRARVRRGKVKVTEKIRRAAYDVVDERDGRRCVLTGRYGNPYSTTTLDRIHHHHIQQLGRDGGPDETWNIVSIHQIVHDLITENRLTVSGNADLMNGLVWTIKEDAVVECFGRKRVPEGVRLVPNEAWDLFIRTEARLA